jgi:hypothetical protein
MAMIKNKYLEELGIPTCKYGTNWVSDDDPRQEAWEKQRKECGFDSRECWNLDHTFIEWLYCHLCMYKEDTNDRVNLTFHKFIFEHKEITQEEAIDIIIDACKDYLTKEESEEIFIKTQKAVHLWAIIFPAMWW